MKRILAITLAGVAVFPLFAAESLLLNPFTEMTTHSPAFYQAKSKAKHFRLFKAELQELYAALAKASYGNAASNEPIQIALPQPDGTVRYYWIEKNTTMHPDLAAKYPQIKTYNGVQRDNPAETVKLDVTPLGFHALIFVPGESPVFIDPLEKSKHLYMVYRKKDFRAPPSFKCGVTTYNQSALSHQPGFSKAFFTCQLKKYRLAMAATAQYTQFHGGTVPRALAAQVTTVNRVNGVYERDVAVTMELIANNDELIYTNPATQPYTSGNPEALIEENQNNIDAVIGSPHYDIGHVVDAAGSGLAALASVCNANEKAQGATGQPNPVGDPFDIDYVAHEMGHQFGANHTQNNECNRNDPTAVEPGSGSTIMGYAGICPPNVQAHSDAYFHGISLQEIGQFLSSSANSCPIKTPIATAPTVKPLKSVYVIPASTPFTLSAQAKSSSNAPLTYTWEQMNPEPSPQPPVSTSTVGPNFRSFAPTVTPTRFLPHLKALAQGGPFTWEVLPSVRRVMDFRVSVRNNLIGGSCNAYADTRVLVDANSGPFSLIYPNAGGIHWQGGEVQNITWNVANTNHAPIASQHVNIRLSIDGGLTYPFFIAKNIPNNGSAKIKVPLITARNARIMVESSNQGFFAVSAKNISITTPYQLTQADRDPIDNRSAFVYYTGVDIQALTHYVINGLTGATISLDAARQRFVINAITTPRKATVSITVAYNDGKSETSNPITIPGIL